MSVTSAAELYRQKRTTADQAVRHVRDGDAIVVPTAAAEPPVLLKALSDARMSFKDVSVSSILPMRKLDYMSEESFPHVRSATYFVSGAVRAGALSGITDFVPNSFSEIPLMLDRGQLPADAVFTLASPMDEHGYFSLSLGPDYTMAAIRNARVLLLEVNPNVPFAFGDCHVHISDVTALVEDDQPIIEVGLPEIGPVHQAIAKHVADMIDDGSTLQIGFGSIPDAVVMQLTGKKDLGIHTEMIGDGIMSLVEAGVITNRRKNFKPGKMLATFALGSKKLYQYMHRNPMIEMHPAEFTNDPYIAGQNDNLISINGTMQVDFLGQCGSESLGYKVYSATGGQVDFVRAANRSKGGKSFIVLPATAKDDTVSRIVPMLTPGTHVTTSKNDVNYVVTEYGVAQLRGKSIQQRTAALIAIAHPKFRDELSAKAREMGYLR